MNEDLIRLPDGTVQMANLDIGTSEPSSKTSDLDSIAGSNSNPFDQYFNKFDPKQQGYLDSP